MLIENISQPICILTISSTILTYVNPAMMKLINVSTSEIEKGATAFDDCFTSVDVPKNDLQLQKLIYDDKPVLLNVKTKYYHGYFSQLSEESLILLLTPCLLKKNVIENKFLRNHESVVDFLENAPIGVHALNSDSEIIWMNEFERKLLGYEYEELHGKVMEDVSNNQNRRF